MNCPACAHENRPGAKFCEECAAPLPRACAGCGAALRPTAKFCDECGAPTGAAPRPPAPPSAAAVEPADTRKVVTIIFGDLVGSTALHERIDAESVRQFMESYYAAMRGAVEAHGGRVTQVMGDGVKAVFGAPRVAEDDAIRAVRAGVAMQDAFRALAERQRGRVGKTGLRVAVNTGEVVANDASEIIGDPVNVAARLQEQGKDGDVVIGESTHRLVSTLVTLELLGSFALKGRSEAVKAYRVVSLDRPAGAATAPFVGREEELARLTAVYTTAVEKPAAGLAVLLGSPGLGKSRLIDEFARRHADAATVVLAHCDAAGGATFAPLADAFRAVLGIESGASAATLHATIESALPAEDADRARIAGGIAALLAGAPPSPEETFFVVRRLLGALAQTKPVVLVIDDLHWAEPLLLDLVEHLIQWGSGVPLLVLIGARPELRDLRSSLVTSGGFVADVVTLSGLDAGAAMRLAANVIGAADLPAAIAAKVLATSEGNPLFVGELVRMLVQEGAITREGDRWIAGANLAALEMPPTIHALLAARIERLRPEERTVLERAAVVGRHFSRSAVAALLPHSGDLDARLEALRRSELIERDTGWLLGEPVLRFHHVLIRDAAYRRLLKGTRAELHAKLADWIEAQTGDAPEHEETIGWHLEQAHQFLRELGPLDTNAQQLGARAATRLAAAGRRALARDDLAVAADLLGRAMDRLAANDPARADLALDWCEALLAAGDVGPAAAAIAELERFTPDSERLRAWHTCFVGQHTVLTAPSALHETTGAVAAAADVLTAQGDAAGEAKAHYVHALALSRLGKVGDCEAALDRALAAARRAGDRRRANTVLAIAPLAALWGPSPVTRASGRCLDVVRVLRITQGAPAVEAVALSCQGVLEALRGRTEAAGRMIASARKMVEELGITQRLLEADVAGGLVALLEGDAIAAERSLRGAYDGLRDLGLGIDAARAAALLARALLAQDRADEAEALSHQSEAIAGDDLKAAIAWRGVRAEALARRGEHVEAVALATRAVELASATDALLDHADARLALAAALRAAGRRHDADAEERRAKELWQAKGATLLAERAAPAAAPVATPVAASVHAPRRRPVRPNRAFEEMRRAEAAVAARDVRALETLYRRDIEIVDHQFGITYGYDAIFERVRAIIEDSTDSAFAHEPLATLGDSLALCRMRSTASGSTAHGISIGATEVPYLLVIEADQQGSARRIDIFGEDKLDDATALLYERHAALLPDGPERVRAAATAHAFAVIQGAADIDLARLASVLASDLEGIDHRHLSLWSFRGAEAYLEHVRGLRQVADEIVLRTGEILALEPVAILRRAMHAGSGRGGGGAYERPLLSLIGFDAAGRVGRIEFFDADREAEALARFEALTAPTATQSSARRVRPNAATAMLARWRDALAARDFDGLTRCFHEDHQEIDHPTGSSYGRDACIASVRRLFRSRDPIFENELLATLGDHLMLVRRWARSSGDTRGRYDVGPYENEALQLLEVDERGLCRRSEVFAADCLGNAVVRLYERYAALLPQGRERAAAAARSLGAFLLAPDDPELVAEVLAPDFESIDHRPLHTWSGRGSSAWLDHLRALRAVAAGVAISVTDLLALESGAMLVRRMHSGTERVGGGDYERPFLVLFATEAAGRLARAEWFDADREAEALARFEALVAEPAAPARRVRPNAATASVARLEAAFAARDAAAWEAEFDASLAVIAHPTGASYGRDGHVHSLLRLAQSHDPVLHFEPIATLGEYLALARRRVAASGATSDRYDVGAYEREEFVLSEIASNGRTIAIEIFALDRLADAIVRLYERYAERLPDGPERVRAEATARSRAALLKSYREDPEAHLGPVLTPGFVGFDHRHLSTWSLHGASAYVEHLRALRQVADDIEFQEVDILALAPNAQLTRVLHTGTDRAGGGVYERPFLSLFATDAEGRLARAEWFDADREAEALARFAAVATPARPSEPFVNAASRANHALGEASNARDFARIEALLAPSLVFDDRRRLNRLKVGREEALMHYRFLQEVPRGRFSSTLLATRGERLALHRTHFDGEVAGGGGAFAVEGVLDLAEIDTEGRVVANVLFDLEDEDAAYAEMDARFEAGEGAVYPHALGSHVRTNAAMRNRDWDAVSAQCAPTFRMRDHRLLGWGTLVNDAATFVRVIRSAAELAPDSNYRHDHLRICARGTLAAIARCGTRDGGAFETPLLRVTEVDAQDRILCHDTYDESDFARARARFAEMEGPALAPGTFENAASATADPLIAAVVANDWARYAALFSEELRGSDRRRLVQLDFDHDAHVAFARALAEGRRARGESATLATRGERLALIRFRFVFEDGDVGPSEIVFLLVTEVDASGRIVAYVRFDDDGLDPAYDELDARYDAAEAALHPHVTAARMAQRRFYYDRDWDAFAATHAPDVVCHDHRLLGWGTLHGADAFVRTQRALVELAPDTGVRNDHFVTSEHGSLRSTRILGTRDGGAFELAFLRVDEIDAAGKVFRIDLYDTGDAAAARARFAELDARDETGLGSFENVASRAWRLVIDAWRTRDSARFKALHPRALRYRDRRRLFQLDLDRQGFLDFTRPLLTMRSAGASIELLATRGKRLAMFRFTMTIEDETVGPSAIDSLLLVETDDRGEIAAYERWDLEDEDAARAELDARFAAAEGARGADRVTVSAFAAALERRDWDAVTACFAPEFLGHDHRLVGWGTVHGPAGLVRTLREMVALASDARMRMNHLRIGPRGSIQDVTWVGTRDGGAFEIPFINVAEYDATGRFVRLDFYDPHRQGRALARFDAIAASERGKPLVTVPRSNAAGEALERWRESYESAFETGDFEPIRALCAPGIVFDDRRRLALLSGDRDFFIAAARERAAVGARPQLELLGTAGDRVAVHAMLWSGGPADGRFEIEYIAVAECDASGLLTAIVLFDSDDPRAAQREAWARWAAIDPAVALWVELLNAVTDAWNARDRAAILARFAGDVVVVDHRHTGIGRVEGSAAYLDANAVLWDLAPDQRIEFSSSLLAFDRHVLAVILRRAGTLAEGGAFESEYVWVSLVTGGRITRLELFEIDAQDEALARFEELRPDPSGG